METAICYRLFSIVERLYNRQEYLLFHFICVRTFLCACVWDVEISVGAPLCVIKRNSDKDRERPRHPQAAHYPSSTITRNPSEDKCLLAAPLISMERRLTQHGTTSLTSQSTSPNLQYPAVKLSHSQNVGVM